MDVEDFKSSHSSSSKIPPHLHFFAICPLPLHIFHPESDILTKLWSYECDEMKGTLCTALCNYLAIVKYLVSNI